MPMYPQPYPYPGGGLLEDDELYTNVPVPQHPLFGGDAWAGLPTTTFPAFPPAAPGGFLGAFPQPPVAQQPEQGQFAPQVPTGPGIGPSGYRPGGNYGQNPATYGQGYLASRGGKPFHPGVNSPAGFGEGAPPNWLQWALKALSPTMTAGQELGIIPKQDWNDWRMPPDVMIGGVPWNYTDILGRDQSTNQQFMGAGMGLGTPIQQAAPPAAAQGISVNPMVANALLNLNPAPIQQQTRQFSAPPTMRAPSGTVGRGPVISRGGPAGRY